MSTLDQQTAQNELFELLLARALSETETGGAATEAPDSRDRASGDKNVHGRITPASRNNRLPLSFPQQRLWFLHEMGVTGNAYTIPMNLHLRGRLDVPALSKALSEVVRRHEVLRTVFRSRDGEPEQLVLPPAELSLLVTEIDADAVEAAVDAHNAAPFDLGRGPILRASLLRLGQAEHVLLMAVHHIAFDGWSVGLFINELTALYRSFRADQSSSLAPVPIQYADFACWQRQTQDSPASRGSIEYWRAQLAEAVPVSLPADLPRPQVLGFRGGSCPFSLPPEVLGPLERLGRERGATLFMVLLAGFALLLQRYSGETRVAIGSPIAGRDHSEVESLLGFFVNSVVMAVDLSGAPDFVTLIDRTRHTALDAFAHANVPFEKLVEALQPERGLDRNPLFQVMLAVQQQEAMQPDLALEGLAATPIPFRQITARFDLELHVWPSGGGLDGICTYNLDLFTAPTVKRIMGHLAGLLSAAAKDPYGVASALPIVSDDAEVPPDPDAGPAPMLCLHQTLANAVRQFPDALALEFGETRLTLKQVDRRANRIAHLLRAHGVVAETLVSLCLDRGDTLITAFLGVFKAGACYLPVDAAEPPERLAFILRDSRPAIHLTQASHAHLFAGTPGIVLCLDQLLMELEAQPDTDPAVQVGPDNLAYIIYTSGSTGQPKGVEGRHGTIANLVAWHLRAHPSTPLRTLQYAQCSFDIFFQELFTSWLTGASCHMVTEAERQNMEALAAFILRHRVERVFMPFTPLQYVIEILSREAAPLSFLQQVFTAGEQLQATQAVRSFFKRNPQARLHNHYGPTECYVVCAHALAADPQSWPDLPPVGRPVDNVRIAIVDRHMAVVPPGAVGEILIGGAQLSRGYRNRPAQTAAAFIPNPFEDDGTRLYRTGDLGRRLTDGSLEFLGRIDRQIKIRGFRIEPGEIEVTLTRHPAIKQALVTTHRYSGTDTRLTAYIVGRSGMVPSTGELRAWLQSRLPRQMVPNGFIVLDALPLNVSGKIDHRALPSPEDAATTSDQKTAARSPREQAIMEIFADLLRRPDLGPHDSFFDLGGHSLLATRVVARLRAALGLELPLVQLFETPTAAGIAAWASRQEGSDAAVRIPAMGETITPASFAQRRLWLLEQMGTVGAAYLMPVNLRLSGALDVAALERSLDAIVGRHAVLRTVMREQDGQPTQWVTPPAPFGLPLTDLTGLPPEARTEAFDTLLEAANTEPFDLAAQPPFRARLVRLAADLHVLLATFHHIACDGWSVMVFFHDLGVLYEAAVNRRRDPLPPLPVQYTDYSTWQRQTLTPDAVERHVAYWRPLLTGLTPLRLPADRRRPPIERLRGAGLRFAVPGDVTDRLRALARAENATLYMVLLTAYMVLLHRFTGDEQIAVGTPVANRDRDEIEPLIGFFVNSLVMTSSVAPDDSFRALLSQVRRNVLGAFTHQALPFETLVEKLAPRRDLSRNPLFQVVFALQQPEAMAARLSLPGLDVIPLDAGEATVRFDLECHVWLHDAALQGLMTFDRDLFDQGTIETFIASYLALLQDIVLNPDCPVGRLRLASPAQAPVTPQASSPVSCLHTIFADTAHTHPARTALTAGADSLTYAELDARSDHLAGHLIGLGVGVGSNVAILMQRGTDLPMAMLAVLKTGCAYVPLEPSLPAERLRYIIAHTAAPIILTDVASRACVPESTATVLVLDSADARWDRRPAGTPARLVHPDDVAYIIYTSGSTGQPKGVAVTHANVTRLFSSTQSMFAFGASDVWSCFHSASFDFSVWEVWGALLHGGRLVMVPPVVARDPGSFLALLRREQVTILNQTPSAFGQLADAVLASGPVPSLRWIVFGGEALDVGSLRRWFDRFGDATPRLMNCYGITETTVHVTLRPLSLADLDLPFNSPIGSPISDLSLHLLDTDLLPVPDLAPGELCVAGPGLARGYLNAPAQTAARFVPDPFGPPGARMYRSGDLARRRTSGDIEYLGRMDNQVKVRGYRIETGEIVARLRAQPAVAEAAVLLRQTGSGDADLFAYIVPSATDIGLDAAQTEDWRRVFDQQLERDWRVDDPLFRLTGWLSSYDRRPIEPDQMRAWADGTVQQIYSLSPRRVLEIGCGTGILLFRLAERVESYRGIDFSAASLDHVRRQIDAHAPRFANVTLTLLDAQDVGSLRPAAYDTIVINSVAQYFPSLETLLNVLRGALSLLEPDGTIYLGDLRDLRLAETFHVSIAQARNATDTNPAELLRQARQGAVEERELLIDPNFFTGIAADLPEVGAVALLSQRGETANELNKYRYAAVLRRKPPPPLPGPVPNGGGDIAALLGGPPGARIARCIPNARLADDVALHNALLGEPPPSGGILPEVLHRQAAAAGYAATIGPDTAGPGLLDIRLYPGNSAPLPWQSANLPRPEGPLASVPTRRQTLLESIPAIRQDLAEWLPDYMVPAHFVVLDRLPLTVNGKLDTRALPATPARSRTSIRQAPATPSEIAIATIFAELLGTGDYDVDDDFFALGGHSLLATRLCSRIRHRFELELPLIRVFESPSIRALAANLDAGLIAMGGAGNDDDNRISGEI